MTLLEYIRKVNKGFDDMSISEQMAISLRFLEKYLVVMGFYEKVDGQNWRQN